MGQDIWLGREDMISYQWKNIGYVDFSHIFFPFWGRNSDFM
jgi:hypothetical protein